MENDIVRFEDLKAKVFKGRQRITTSCLPVNMQFTGYIGDTLNEYTIAREVEKAMKAHQQNAAEYNALKNVYLGEQSIVYRPDADRWVDNRVCINYAQAFTRDITGYTYGGGIQYVARGDKNDLVQKLNDYVKAENKDVAMKTIGDHQSIGGRGYLGVFPDALDKNDVPFEFVEFDPRTTEVVYSAYNPAIPVFAWTEYDTEVNGEAVKIVSIWTNDRQYTLRITAGTPYGYDALLWNTYTIDGEEIKLPYRRHLLGEIPIIEYANNEFRLGDWECAISLFDAINSIASDGVNDIEQTVCSYLALFGVDLGETVEEQRETLQAMRENRILAFSADPGVSQDAKFITAQLDGTSAHLLRNYLEEALKFIVGIPDRDTGSTGSDTGIAAQVRSGSGDIEIVAQNKCLYTIAAERRALRIVLNILKESPATADTFRDLSVVDIDIEIPRNKTDNLQSKVQAMSTLNAMGVSKIDVVKMGDLTTDQTGFVRRWEDSLASQTEQNGGADNGIEN